MRILCLLTKTSGAALPRINLQGTDNMTRLNNLKSLFNELATTFNADKISAPMIRKAFYKNWYSTYCVHPNCKCVTTADIERVMVLAFADCYETL
jgi:hypothetical protein